MAEGSDPYLGFESKPSEIKREFGELGYPCESERIKMFQNVLDFKIQLREV